MAGNVCRRKSEKQNQYCEPCSPEGADCSLATGASPWSTAEGIPRFLFPFLLEAPVACGDRGSKRMGAGRLSHHGLAPVAREQWRTSGPHSAAGEKQDGGAKRVQGPMLQPQARGLDSPRGEAGRPSAYGRQTSWSVEPTGEISPHGRGLAASSLPLKGVAPSTRSLRQTQGRPLAPFDFAALAQDKQDKGRKSENRNQRCPPNSSLESSQLSSMSPELRSRLTLKMGVPGIPQWAAFAEVLPRLDNLVPTLQCHCAVLFRMVRRSRIHYGLSCRRGWCLYTHR